MGIWTEKTLMQINTDAVTCFLISGVDQNGFTATFKSEPFPFDKRCEMRNPDPTM